ncbi:uncharacterized protein LOC142556388 [Primulina tabacum]|uniref:uncharacterized protein LOC142556388 n=1 Tax=Primulina tabacum TaxID=48773 RepID=UPI003F5A6345
MARTESRLENLETHMASIGATLKILESQVGQITKQLMSQPSGAVQKNADPNLREANAIFMQHEEIGVVSKEEKVDQPTPSKRNRGASVNIMPSFLYEKLGLSRIKPTALSLQMADKSVRTPLGIVEDVELKIDKIRLQANFVVLDMGNSQNVRAILGRPFLATAEAVIDLRQGKLTMEVDGQNIELKASKISYDPP